VFLLDARHLVAVVLRRDLPDQFRRSRARTSAATSVVALLLAVFSIGIGAGSLLCEKLSRRQVEIGLVPLGSIGMTVFAIDLYFASRGLHGRWRAGLPGAVPRAAGALARRRRPGAAGAVRRLLQRAAVRADPAALRAHAPRAHHRRQQHPQRAVHGRGLAGWRRRCCRAGLTIPAAVPGHRADERGGGALHLPLVPEFLLRFLAWLLTHTLYRVRKIVNTENASRSRARRCWPATT
jgi:hypothetical protein